GAAAGTERHRTRELGGGRPDAGDETTLLVDRDLQRDLDLRPAVAVGERGVLQPVRERHDLLGAADVVGPREVDDAAQVVLADHLGRAGHAVERHVALVGGRRVGAVDVLDEELADLLLQRHPREPGGHPAVLAAGAWLAGRGAAGTPTAGERRPGDA